MLYVNYTSIKEIEFFNQKHQKSTQVQQEEVVTSDRTQNLQEGWRKTQNQVRMGTKTTGIAWPSFQATDTAEINKCMPIITVILYSSYFIQCSESWERELTWLSCSHMFTLNFRIGEIMQHQPYDLRWRGGWSPKWKWGQLLELGWMLLSDHNNLR